jgi:hypothetical protein
MDGKRHSYDIYEQFPLRFEGFKAEDCFIRLISLNLHILVFVQSTPGFQFTWYRVHNVLVVKREQRHNLSSAAE